MDEEMKENLLFKMNNASLELIKTGTGIGMTNACLRIKMMTDKKARFDLETEVGVGTTVFIAVPKKKGSVRSA
jgi:two-component system sensor histidine kinase YesM